MFSRVFSFTLRKHLHKLYKYGTILLSMGNFGKKLIAVVLAAVAGVAVFGCAEKGQGFAKTPEEEYDRICSLDGENVIFDFSTLRKLQIKQTVHLDSPLLREANGGQAVEETTLYQLDKSDAKSPISYGETNYVNSMYLPSLTEKINFSTEKYGYKNLFDYFGRLFADGYEEYLGASSTRNSPDIVFRRSIKLFPRENFESMSGGKSGNAYVIEAEVKSDAFSEFMSWFESFYPFIHHKNDIDGKYKFYDASKIQSVTFQIKSSRTGLSEVSFSAVMPADPDAFGADATDGSGNVTENVTVNAKTEFARSGFEITAKDEHGHW